ncbi:hypothetical protein C8R44DRAFT_880708 [Mycena epipterygia]|nr:hypothetical protein C8R44DRAFT_880708 [Mycena epipterygia]
MLAVDQHVMDGNPGPTQPPVFLAVLYVRSLRACRTVLEDMPSAASTLDFYHFLLSFISTCAHNDFTQLRLWVPTNKTINDAGSLVEYFPSGNDLCVGCVFPDGNYSVEELFNRTIARHTLEDGLIVLNFTSEILHPHSLGPASNSISGSPNSTSASTSSTTVSNSAPNSLVPDSASSASSLIAAKKTPVGAITDGAVSGIAAILALAAVLFCWRQAQIIAQRGNTRRIKIPSRNALPRVLAQDVCRPDAQSSVASDNTSTSVSRSIFTMKRDQTRIVREHQYRYSGYGHATVRDSLVHTDSGLRLTAQTVADEDGGVPPTYVTE